MRYFIYTTVFICIISCNLSAQTLHLKPGVAFSRTPLEFHVPFLREDYKGSLKSYSFMADLEYLEQTPFSIISGLHFYNTGARLNAQDYLKDISKISFHYMSINNTINVKPVNKKFVWQLQFGPRADVLIKSNKKDAMKLVEEYITTFNYGFTSGTGLYKKSDKHLIGISAYYYNRSKMILDKDKPSWYVRHARIKDNPFFLNFSYSFKLKGD